MEILDQFLGVPTGARKMRDGGTRNVVPLRYAFIAAGHGQRPTLTVRRPGEPTVRVLVYNLHLKHDSNGGGGPERYPGTFAALESRRSHASADVSTMRPSEAHAPHAAFHSYPA